LTLSFRRHQLKVSMSTCLLYRAICATGKRKSFMIPIYVSFPEINNSPCFVCRESEDTALLVLKEIYGNNPVGCAPL